jgi:hypothetical protein
MMLRMRHKRFLSDVVLCILSHGLCLGALGALFSAAYVAAHPEKLNF